MTSLLNIVTGRWGIGRISARRLNREMNLMRTAVSFQRMKEAALDSLKRGDVEGARFYAKQARHDWSSIKHTITA